METEIAASWVREVEIRAAREEDLPALEWEGEFIHFRRLYLDAFRRMQRHLSLIWLAFLPEAGLIGQVFIQLDSERPEMADGKDRAYLYGFRIRPTYRSQGLGSRMLNFVQDDLRERGYTLLCLNVAIDNPRAQSLYTRLGFEVVAHEPGIWSYIDHLGRRCWVEEPAWRMEKQL